MKKILYITLSVITFLTYSANIARGDVLTPLDQWNSTTTPVSAITQRQFGKTIKITGLSPSSSLCLDSNNLLTTSGCAGGGGSASSPFISATNFSTTTSATTTPLWLRGSKFSLFASSTSVFDYASTTALSATTLCLVGDICRTTWPSSGGGGVSDWNKQTNYSVLTLTPTSTIPVWVKDQFFASSSAVIAGLLTANNFVATSSSVASVFPYASTTQISSTISYSTLSSSTQFTAMRGSTAAPAYSFATDPLMGMYVDTSVGVGNGLVLIGDAGNTTLELSNNVISANNKIVSSVESISFPSFTSTSNMNVGTGVSFTSGKVYLSVTKSPVLTATSIGVGISSTSPYAPLSVVGNGGVVAENYTATTSKTSNFPYASSTSLTVSGAFYNSSLTTGCLSSASGLITSSGSACNSGTLTAVTGTFPIASSGGTTPNITFGGLSTSSPISAGGALLYATGVNTVASVATSTLTASSPLTGSFTQIGSSGSLGCQTASGSQAGCLSSTDWNTFNNKGSGTVTSVTGTYPIISSGGNTPAISTAFGTTTLGKSMILATDATGNLFSTSSPSAAFYNATSTTATSTFNGALIVGNLAKYPYLKVASTSPNYGYVSNDVADLGGTLNDFIAVNSFNNANTACATADFAVNNDTATVSSNFGDLGHTSSTFTGSGCTNNPFTGFGVNSTYVYDPNGNMNFALGSTTNGSFRWFTAGYASTNQKMTLLNAGQLGIGTSTPYATLSVNGAGVIGDNLTTSYLTSTSTATSTFAGPVIIGSTTTNLGSLIVTNGSIMDKEYAPATTTTMVVDFASSTLNKSSNQTLIQAGTSNITLSFANTFNGATERVIRCNPASGSGGIFVWPNNVLWPAGTAPTQTTTAKKCDVFSFIVTQATSTSATTATILGNSSVNF